MQTLLFPDRNCDKVYCYRNSGQITLAKASDEIGSQSRHCDTNGTSVGASKIASCGPVGRQASGKPSPARKPAPRGGGGTPYNGLYREAPPERDTFFRLDVCERVGISRVQVWERVGKTAI